METGECKADLVKGQGGELRKITEMFITSGLSTFYRPSRCCEGGQGEFGGIEHGDLNIVPPIWRLGKTGIEKDK